LNAVGHFGNEPFCQPASSEGIFAAATNSSK
jgi:hypothetical protein